MFSPLPLGALNHLLGQADWARAKLLPFAGMSARLAMPPWQLDFSIGGDGRFEAATGGEPDVTMTLPFDAPLRGMQGLEKIIEAARVEGSAQFATELSFVLRNLRWDVEEDLSRLVGDVAAHRLGQGANDLAAWQRDAARRLAENVAEYVSEEDAMLVPAQDVAAFGNDVERLRGDLVRLENRIEKFLKLG